MSAETFERIGQWGLQTGLSVAILIAFILIIRKAFARQFGSEAMFWLWSLPVLRVFLPSFSLPRFWPEKTQTTEMLSFTAFDRPIDASPSIVEPALDIWPIIVLLWLSIAGLWFAWQFRGHLTFISAVRRQTEPATEALRAELGSAAGLTGLKRSPELRLATDDVGPMVVGLVRPLLIVPTTFAESYTLKQRRFALVHELCHLKRRDLWSSFASLVMRSLFWPNPLVHFALRAFRTDLEAACDARVLRCLDGHATPYAQTLLQAAKRNPASAHVPRSLGFNRPRPLSLAFTPKAETGPSKGDDHADT